MMEKCRLCHYQPLLLLYANPIGTPVNADSAPKERILINGAVHEKGTEGKQSVKGLNTERGTADGVSDCEKSPVMSKKSKSRNKPKLDKKSLFRSKKSLSSGDLSIPKKELTRSPSNASDSTTSSPGKERHRPSFKRIGTAIMSAMNPALAVSHLKQNKKKGSSKSRRSSTGSSESSGDPDLIDLRWVASCFRRSGRALCLVIELLWCFLIYHLSASVSFVLKSWKTTYARYRIGKFQICYNNCLNLGFLASVLCPKPSELW